MIEARGLCKDYRVPKKAVGLGASVRSLFKRDYVTVHAVRDLSFTIADGERVGFLGPNGAGKTTTLKMLTGLLHPTAGDAVILGFTPKERQREFLRQITLVMGQKQQLIWDLPPAETFELNRALFDIDRREYKATLDELVTLLELGPLLEKPTRNLSLGERMKCEIAASLLHRPRVLFLDEPTIGLDITMQAAVRRFIREYNERHAATVVLTSHYMADVEALAQRLLVIDHGKLRYDGSLQALVRSTAPHKRVRVRLSSPVAASVLEALQARRLDGGAEVELLVEPAHLAERVAEVLRALPVEDLTVEDPDLEDVLPSLFTREDAA